MFCIQLNGGLGNQMFQYAFGRAMSEKYNVPFILDCSVLEKHTTKANYTLREFELSIFNLDAKKATYKDLKKFKFSIFINKLNFKIEKIFKVSSLFDSNIINDEKKISNLNTSKNTLFIGYWQSDFFFKEISELIKKDFFF